MSLRSVTITEEVLLTCMTHALTTEGEEIMGLLLGDITEGTPGQTVSNIWMAYPQIRTDRRKDRVETSPEQMARCTAHAERLSREHGIRTRVVGWYHSHPHITVLPSHVDVRTQGMYQMLDPGFVGLIFSVFNSDSGSKAGQVQVTAFQSVPQGHPAAAHGGGIGGGGGLLDGELVSYSSEALAGLDTPTKQAIRASAAAMHDAAPTSMVRKEVPLRVARARTADEGKNSLHDLVVVQHILALEERDAFIQATRPPSRSLGPGTALMIPMESDGGGLYNVVAAPAAGGTGGSMSGSAGSGGTGAPHSLGLALSQLHASGAYQQALAQVLEVALSSALVGMRSLAAQHAQHVAQLTARNQALKELITSRRKQIALLSSISSGSIGAPASAALPALHTAGGSGQHQGAHPPPTQLGSSSLHTTGASSQATPRSPLGQGGGSGLVSGLDAALQQQATLGGGPPT